MRERVLKRRSRPTVTARDVHDEDSAWEGGVTFTSIDGRPTPFLPDCIEDRLCSALFVMRCVDDCDRCVFGGKSLIRSMHFLLQLPRFQSVVRFALTQPVHADA